MCVCVCVWHTLKEVCVSTKYVCFSAPGRTAYLIVVCVAVWLGCGWEVCFCVCVCMPACMGCVWGDGNV